jgi:hypothetical protein
MSFSRFPHIPFAHVLDHESILIGQQLFRIPIIFIYVNQIALFRSRLQSITGDFLSGNRFLKMPERAKSRSGSPKIWVMSVEDFVAAWTWVLGKAEVGEPIQGRCGWMARIRLSKARDKGKAKIGNPGICDSPPCRYGIRVNSPTFYGR